MEQHSISSTQAVNWLIGLTGAIVIVGGALIKFVISTHGRLVSVEDNKTETIKKMDEFTKDFKSFREQVLQKLDELKDDIHNK